MYNSCKFMEDIQGLQVKKPRVVVIVVTDTAKVCGVGCNCKYISITSHCLCNMQSSTSKFVTCTIRDQISREIHHLYTLPLATNCIPIKCSNSPPYSQTHNISYNAVCVTSETSVLPVQYLLCLSSTAVCCHAAPRLVLPAIILQDMKKGW